MNKIFIAGASVVVVAAAIISIRLNRISDSLFTSNVDALARNETVLMGSCKEELRDCVAVCRSCNRAFYAPGQEGGAYNVDWSCSACKDHETIK